MKVYKHKSLFIVFEGIDGSGKTTTSKRLKDFFIKKGMKTHWLLEPSFDSKWGKKIRELANLKESIPIEEELNYFIEDRKLDLKNNIIPALNSGEKVILDRYYYSNACYQGAKGMEIGTILKKNLEFSIVPDITFIIDVSVETALKRIKSNREETAILFEKEDYLKKVRENYLSLKSPEIKIINGEGSADGVFELVIAHFEF